eukprot:gene12095-25367_t
MTAFLSTKIRNSNKSQKSPARNINPSVICSPVLKEPSLVSLEKIELLDEVGQHRYAVATTDSAFKHMLSSSFGHDSAVVISLLDCFIPLFDVDTVKSVREAPTAIPALRKLGEKQTFMDLHVNTNLGSHYIIEMQAQRHLKFDERALFYACGTFAR